VRQTVVMVTHDPMCASYADTVLFLADGQFAGTMSIDTTPAISVDRIAERMMRLEGCC
jgi:putative ABC transport system ATP-binding protein